MDIMAIVVVKNTKNLDRGFILTPERYNPKRRLSVGNLSDCVSISEIVTLVSDMIKPEQASSHAGKVIIVNTGDVCEGHIKLTESDDVNWSSNKKIVQSGDVIISRLRPYLRQVAYVDNEIYAQSENCICAVSTEFYVLRGRKNRSIGFLVPLLLSDRVQAVLASAVEGSQHPRFKEDVLLDIAIPKSLLTIADELSSNVARNVLSIRRYEKSMSDDIKSISTYI